MDRLDTIYNNNYFRTFMIIFIVIVAFLLVYKISKYLYQHKKKSLYLIEGVKDGRKTETIGGGALLPSSTGYEFTFSTWLYIKDWGYKYDQPKHVFQFGSNESPHPRVTLYPQENNLSIEMATYKRGGVGIERCDLKNIRVQRWIHLGLVLQNKTLDVYLNGNLARSCTFENVPKLLPWGDLIVTKDGGFEGVISDLFYSNEAFSATHMNFMYRKGHTHIDIEKYFANIYPKLENIEKTLQCIKKI